jgi:hypothetical protein
LIPFRAIICFLVSLPQSPSEILTSWENTS